MGGQEHERPTHATIAVAHEYPELTVKEIETRADDGLSTDRTYTSP
jgi:hypothetical protein